MSYTPDLLAHYKRPNNRGRLADATHAGTVRNPLCGDELTVQIRVSDGVIEDVAFDGVGCAISIASASIQTEDWKGRRVDEVAARTPDHAVDALAVKVSPGRIRCAGLALEAVAARIPCPQPS